jgi:hypothetical protein
LLSRTIEIRQVMGPPKRIKRKRRWCTYVPKHYDWSAAASVPGEGVP